ncbi:MAG: DUF5320 domain-containing protein [Candidatus Gastranaerophilales bacterium]|nr:DUF5320 domain-containing protein [Candidatus Gastranaerophilales bacterium]
MPGLDGTGPAGQGQRTGRGKGQCNGNWQGKGRGQQSVNCRNLQGMPAQDELTIRKAQKASIEQRIKELEDK